MVIIALSGCDGSGKTTLAIKLKEMLKKNGIKVEYRREFEYFLLKYLLKMLGERVNVERRKFLKKEGPFTKFDYLKYRLWTFLVWVDLNVEILYLKLAKRKNFVISDRCIVDHIVGFEYLGYVTKSLRNFMLKNSIKPDLIIILEAPPNIMYERKKKTHDYPLDFYKVQRGRYLEIAKKFKIPIINTYKDKSESLNEAIMYILLKLAKPEDVVLHVLSNPIDNSSLHTERKLNRINWNIINLNYILIETSRNNIELQLYERILKYRPESIFIKALELVNSKYNTFLNTLADVTNILEKSGIDYIVFKTIPPFKSLPRDIDVLVSERDKDKAIKILTSKGFKVTKTHTIHREISLSKNGIDIDLHWKIEWMGYKIINENTILQNYTFYKLGDINVKLPDPSHEFLLVVAHSILQHHYLTLGEAHYIRALIRNYRIDWDLILETFKRKHLFKSFMHLMAIVTAKEILFYNNDLLEKIDENIKRYLSSRDLITFSEAVKPVTWLNLKALPISNILNLIDIMLTVYRKMRYNLTGVLPYNVPLREIVESYK